MEFDGLMNMEQNDLPMDAIVGSNDTINSSTPMEKALAQLVTIMQEIMRILACNIRNICFTKANAISHPRLVLCHVEDGLGNNVKQLKDWHETMFNHTNVHTKKCHK
jgi:hypothetical protein